MKKKIRFTYKLFYMILFYLLFASVTKSENNLNFSNKISPELEKIEALPRRSKPAELNIEIKKLKSEPLEDVYIDKKNKNFYIDFSKKITKEYLKIDELDKKYDVIISENIQGQSEVNGRKKNQAKLQSTDYEVVDFQGKKVLKFPYEKEYEKLYISIQKNEEIVKVYSLNVKNAKEINTGKNLLEEKVVIVNLKDQIEKWKHAKFVFSLNGELLFSPTGATGELTTNVDSKKVEIIKKSGFNNQIENDFINSFKEKTTIKLKSNSYNLNKEVTITKENNQNSNEVQFAYKQKPDGSGEGQDVIKIKYLTDGNLVFEFQQIDSIGKTSYTIEMEHIKDGSDERKKHTLIINAEGENIPIEEIDVTLKYKNGYSGNWYGFDGNGYIVKNNDENLNVYIKNKFLTTEEFNPQTYPKIKVIDLNTKKEKELRYIDYYVQETLELENGVHITPQFLANGRFEFNLGNSIGFFPLGPKYKILLEHRNYLGVLKQKQILNIDTEKIIENIQLKLLKGFNKDTSIIFNKEGLNLPNTELNSDKKRYLKSLDIGSNHNYINDVELFEIDNSGNSKNFNIILFDKTDSNKKLELNMEYKNKYPVFKILNKPKSGVYLLNISHNNSDNEEKLRYAFEIIIEPGVFEEFEVTSNINNILVLPDKTIKSFDNWIKVVQLVDDKSKFPVIGVNNPKWEIETDAPFNVIDNRPMAALKLGDNILKVPVNIKETPYQKTEKFFIYDRGEMTNRNIAVGGYTPHNSEETGKNNVVQVNFQILFEDEDIEKLISYAETQMGESVEIPYDFSSEDNTIYAIRGLLNKTSKIFKVSKENILSDGVINFPKIIVLKNNNSLKKNIEIKLLPKYDSQAINFISNSNNHLLDETIEIYPKNDLKLLEGLGYEHKIRLILPNGEIKEYNTNNIGATTSDIEEILEKNGKKVKIHIKYLKNEDVKIWITEREGTESFNFTLQHIDFNGEIKKTTNILLISQVEDNEIKTGELNLTISSRYNAFSGQLNSKPLVITSKSIDYQSEVLDLTLLNGSNIVHPGTEKEIFIRYSYFSEEKEVKLNSNLEIETTKLKVEFKKDPNTGDISIKPLNWQINSVDEFTLIYKTNNQITNQYKFNVKCPEFFVASFGTLDFGKIYKIEDSKDKTVKAPIELYYNDSVIEPTYSLDVLSADSDPGTLYLDDERPSKLKVVDLKLKQDKIEKITSNGKTGQKITLLLEGTIPKESIKNANPGSYEKTVQILIHLK